MSNQGSNVADDILDVIELAIEKRLNNLKNNFVRTTIVEMSEDNTLYVVKINGADYNIYSGCGITFQVGDAVWVHIPDGDYKKAYICASAFRRDIFQEITSYIGVSVNADLAKMLSNYPSNAYLSSNYLRINDFNRAISDYDTSDQVDAKLGNYIKKDESGGLLDEYYTKDEIDTKLQDYSPGGALDDYYSKTEVDNKLQSYATNTNLANALSDYLAKSEVDQALSGYAKTSDLDDYYTKSEIDTKLQDYSQDGSLDDYYTKSEVDTALTDYVKKTEVSATLSNYATKSDVSTTLGDYVTDTELTQTLANYATLQALADIVAGDIGDLPIHELYLTSSEPTDCNDKDIWISATT